MERRMSKETMDISQLIKEEINQEGHRPEGQNPKGANPEGQRPKKEEKMKTINRLTILSVLFFCMLVFGLPSAAKALGTIAGTTISNSATVNFDVNAQAQTPVVSDSGTPTTFVVDNKVIVGVSVDSSPIDVALSSSDNVIAFTVSNTGNTTQSYALSVEEDGASDFSMTTNPPVIWVDGPSSGFDGDEVLYVNAGTYFEDIAPDTSFKVFILADAPASGTNGDDSIYNLLATTWDAGAGGKTSETVGADTAGVDVVFAEDTAGSGPFTGDGLTDGEASAQGIYNLLVVELTIAKSSQPIWDPINLFSNPKAIPGAYVEYSITVTHNAGTDSADSVTITDSLASEIAATRLAWVAQFDDNVTTCAADEGIVYKVNAGAVTCLTNDATDDGAIDGDYDTSFSETITVENITLTSGDVIVVRFLVEVQ